MSTNTTNYNLVKPGSNEYYDINVPNGNMDVIDTKLKENADAVVNLAGTGRTTETVKANADAIAAHQADDIKHLNYSTASGTDTYTATIADIESLVEGLSVKIKFTNANTGASTLNINSLGAIDIKKGNGNALVSGNIKAGQIVHLVYTGTVFQLLGEGGEYGTATANDVRSTKTLGTENGIIQDALDLSNLVSANIKKDINIGGVVGSVHYLITTAGDVTVSSSLNAKSTSPTSYIKLKEMRWDGEAGTVRVKFNLRTDNGYNMVYGRIYKNGIAVGIERATSGTSDTTFTEDIAVTTGDLIQMYGRTADGGNNSFISNFILSISSSSVAAKLLN